MGLVAKKKKSIISPDLSFKQGMASHSHKCVASNIIPLCFLPTVTTEEVLRNPGAMPGILLCRRTVSPILQRIKDIIVHSF